MSTAPSPSPPDVTGAVLIIGNEILSGRTRDQNLDWLAGRLFADGVALREARVVGDLEAEIIAAVNALRARYTYVFTTGGIGPTHDDITAAAVARAFAVPLVQNSEALARLTAYYAGKRELNASRLRMTYIPEGATLIDNPVSGAPGFRMGNVFVMAGVPAIMAAMFDGIRHTLSGGLPVVAISVRANLPEGDIAGPLALIQDQHPLTDIGSYPFYRHQQLGVTLVVRGQNRDDVTKAVVAVCRMVADHGGEAEQIEGQA